MAAGQLTTLSDRRCRLPGAALPELPPAALTMVKALATLTCPFLDPRPEYAPRQPRRWLPQRCPYSYHLDLEISKG